MRLIRNLETLFWGKKGCFVQTFSKEVFIVSQIHAGVRKVFLLKRKCRCAVFFWGLNFVLGKHKNSLSENSWKTNPRIAQSKILMSYEEKQTVRDIFAQDIIWRSNFYTDYINLFNWLKLLELWVRGQQKIKLKIQFGVFKQRQQNQLSLTLVFFSKHFVLMVWVLQLSRASKLEKFVFKLFIISFSCLNFHYDF